MALPPMQPIKSSMFTHFHHDPATSKLTVRYHNGKVWQYEDVGVDKAVTMQGALSPGRYFNEKIKGIHPGREILE